MNYILQFLFWLIKIKIIDTCFQQFLFWLIKIKIIDTCFQQFLFYDK